MSRIPTQKNKNSQINSKRDNKRNLTISAHVRQTDMTTSLDNNNPMTNIDDRTFAIGKLFDFLVQGDFQAYM
jgi:hypothetical protein